jgi:CPA1 family monovalent cation:H+ antiporter
VNLFQKSAPIHWRFQLVSFWGGLRGAIALALALSLSSDFAHQELIISMTLGVVLFTILVEGSTTSQLVRLLGLDRLSVREELAQSQARVFAKKEVMQLLGEMGNQRLLSPSILNKFKKEYQQACQQAEKSLETFWESLRKQPTQMRQLFWLQVLQIEHHAYRELHDEGLISGLVLKKLSLMMNWKGDGVLSNQIPPRVAKTKMLENVWEKFLLNRLLVWIPKRYWLQKHRLHELTIRYEYYAAIAYVSDKVVQTIRQLAREEAVDDTIASECIEFYQKNGEAAFEWIESFVQERPELAFPMQQRVIERAVSLREIETIEYLANKGIIPESAIDKIRQQIVSS